jgi:hypothetical protein
MSANVPARWNEIGRDRISVCFTCGYLGVQTSFPKSYCYVALLQQDKARLKKAGRDGLERPVVDVELFCGLIDVYNRCIYIYTP